MHPKRQALNPQSAFILGLIAGVGIFFIVGFFALLKPVLSGRTGISLSWLKLGGNKAPQAWVRGGRDAKVTVVEYSDLECPFCKQFHATMKQVINEYGGKVKWEFRHFPLTQLHPKAPKEAEAAECAGELGGNDAFWKFVDRVYEVTPGNNGLDPAELPKIAEYVGLKKQKFETCLSSGKYAAKVQAETAQAQADGAQGTPYSLIVSGDKRTPVSGAVPLESLKGMIEPLLK